jgi:hypothetical protein
MADLDPTTAILIAIITAFSVLVGGLITSGVNYQIEQQRSKRETEKYKRDSEAQEIALRNEAYKRFLGLTWIDAFTTEASAERVREQIIALILMHGSSEAKDKLLGHYPIKTPEDWKEVRGTIIHELTDKKVESKPSQEEAKKKGWWQFWR